VTTRKAWRAALAVLAMATAGGAPAGSEPAAPRFVRVDYRSLVDARKLTHSGEPVGVLLARLAGRPMPAAGERRDDALAYRLLDPILEPYAFVLPDALDALAPPHDPPMVEVGALWETGEAQPAWVELVRARRLLLESDGEGHLRAFLPASSLEALSGELPAGKDAASVAKEAWDEAWPVLRHALTGERLRLARHRGGEPPALEVEVHAYRHVPAISTFDLGVAPWRTSVTDTGPLGNRAPLELSTLASILERGLTIEGARLESAGRIRWFTSESDVKRTILGRPPTLADAAVAYRAVARGGNGEPYMSLDRAESPQIANVNYGGRLRDTSLGLVSLLSDVRFKTFSVGVDLLGAGDVRDAIRKTLPDFRSHLERFAADPTAGAILNQQTRFWFYPDDVQLTLSQEGDVLAFRRVRMSAASERVRDAGAAASDPPWTKDTVAYLNAHYDALSGLFPEMADLDESVRLLALFTWLESARTRGLDVPDLDVLLAVELPAQPTPRRFPQLLSHDVLPPPGSAGVVDVLDRTDVGDALDRLDPRGGRPLPAARRLARDRAMLNPQIPDQAALAKEMDALGAGADPSDKDLLSYRAERLLMHARVLATIPPGRRAAIDERRKQAPATRVFSVGIGGVDLGMSAVLARAENRGGKLGLTAGDRAAKPSVSGASPSKARVTPPPARATSDPPGLPSTAWPDHGLGAVGGRAVTTLPDGRGAIQTMSRPGSLVRSGAFKVEGGGSVAWQEVVLAMDGPEARSRRRIADPKGDAPVFERVEEGRFVSYRFDRGSGVMRAVPAVSPLPAQAFSAPMPPAVPAAAAPELILLDLVPPADGGTSGDATEPPSVNLRLRTPDGRERVAAIPRTVLQRLVRGRAIDLSPDRPLPAFSPASGVLGSSHTLMVLASADETRAPWSGPTSPWPGEEDAARLAAALSSWWSAEPASPAVAVVGVDVGASPSRWARVPRLGGPVAVLAPDDAFPAQAASFRAGLKGLPEAAGSANLIVVVSAEAPGVFGRRLRALASNPEFSGKAVAAVSLGGALRPDLPASLLAEGKLAALGVLDAGPLGLAGTVADVAGWIRQAAGDAAKGRRPEDVLGGFTWYY